METIIELIAFLSVAIPAVVILGRYLYTVNRDCTTEGFVVLWIYYGLYLAGFAGTILFALFGNAIGTICCFLFVAFNLFGAKISVWIILQFVKLLEKLNIVPTPEESDKSITIKTQGRIVKAIEEKVGYYRLAVLYNKDGKTKKAKTRRGYSLAAIAAILRKSNIVDIEVRGDECELPPVPKEEIKGIYDKRDLKSIKICDTKFTFVGKILYLPVYAKVLPIIIATPLGILYAFREFSKGHFESGMWVIFLITLVFFFAIREFVQNRRAVKAYIEMGE